MFSVKRPKPGETEDDLLQEQEEFLKSQSKPAASVVRKVDKRHNEDNLEDSVQTNAHEQQRDVVDLGGLPSLFPHTSAAPPVKKSKFKDKQEQKKKARFQFDPETIDDTDQHITKVLSDIVEHDIQNIPVYYPKSPTTRGFPVAPHRGSMQGGDDGGKKKSIFARQFALGKASDFGLKTKPTPKHNVMHFQEKKRLDTQKVASSVKSILVSGGGLSQAKPGEEAQRIHEDNMEKLVAMSEAEIIEEQTKLVQSLDPSLLAFLKSRRQETTLITDSQSQSSSFMDTSESSSSTGKKDVVELMDSSTSVPVNRKSEEKVKRTGLPVPPKKKYVHMDVVEEDKLKWTKDLPPPPKADYNKTGQPARFDFQGNLLPVDAEIATNVGLHHHGQEPERAGYTLAELFQLARSANMQQRVLALTTVARILRNARDGSLYQLVQSPIIPALLDGGLIFILRWALDDSTDNTVAAAVHCFHALLVCPQDEEAADDVFSWHNGFSLPQLKPMENEPGDDEEKDEKENQTDATLLQQDVIKGLLKMQILQRLRYILEVWKPAASVVRDILQVLTRFARHSPQTCYEIMQCPRLIEAIFKEFLPTTWVPIGEDTALAEVHGFPVPEAMKLVRVICSAGRNMAAALVSKFWLMTSISRYIVEDPSDLHLPLAVASNLQIESLKTWQVVTRYGLASSSFTDLYSMIAKSLQCLPSLYHMSNDSMIKWGSAMVGVLEAVVGLAASTRQLNTQKPQRDDSSFMEGNISLPAPEVDWSQVSSLYQPIEMCVQHTLKEFVQIFMTKKHDLTFAASCLNFITTFISKVQNQPGYEAVDWLDRLENLSSLLIPFLSSPAFRKCLDILRSHSALIWIEKLKRSEVTENLPEMGVMVLDNGDLNPLIKKSSTLNFVIAVSRCVYSVGKHHKDLQSKLFHYLLRDEDLVLYLRKCCQAKQVAIAPNTFVRYENILQYYLVKMACLQPDQCETQLYHQVALLLMSRLHQGDEHLAHELLSSVIFNHSLLGDISTVESAATAQLEQMKLCTNQTQSISSATRETIKANYEYLSMDVTDHLSSMRNSYLTVASGLIHNQQCSRSRWLIVPHQTDSLVLGRMEEVITPIDWPFLPLVDLFNKTSQGEGSGENVSPQLLRIVTDTLRFIYTLEQWRPVVLESVSFVTKYSRLMCTFLAGSDLFLDPKVHLYLESIYRIYCQPSLIEKMDFTKKVPGLVSFYDFFVLFVIQYEAVSFGDGLFGSFLLIPIQQRHDLQMRKAIWTEHTTILRTFSMPLQQVPLPLENFLHPDESNAELVRLYYQALHSGAVCHQWSPLFYLIAVHHVNRFIFSQDPTHTDLRLSMIRAIQQSNSVDLLKDVLYYQTHNRAFHKGIVYYTVLPAHRQKTLNDSVS